MITLRSAKISMAIVLIAAAVTLLSFFLIYGVSPAHAALMLIALTAVILAAYALSDRLMMALTGASNQDVPASLMMAVKRYCDEEHIPVPGIAIVRKQVPDVYIGGISKGKGFIVITSGAIGQIDEGKLGAMAILELDAVRTYKALDMAAMNMLLIPLARAEEQSIRHRMMRNGFDQYGQQEGHVSFRKAEDKDFLSMYRSGVDAFCESTGFVTLHKLAYLYEKPTAISLIAEYDGKPAGFAVGHITRGSGGIYGHIDVITVDRPYRENGIGIGLTGAVIRAMEGYGCLQCCLEVWQQNEAAIRLYEKAGFAKRAVLEDYYKKGQHAQVMCKKLIAR